MITAQQLLDATKDWKDTRCDLKYQVMYGKHYLFAKAVHQAEDEMKKGAKKKSKSKSKKKKTGGY